MLELATNQEQFELGLRTSSLTIDQSFLGSLCLYFHSPPCSSSRTYSEDTLALPKYKLGSEWNMSFDFGSTRSTSVSALLDYQGRNGYDLHLAAHHNTNHQNKCSNTGNAASQDLSNTMIRLATTKCDVMDIMRVMGQD